MVLSKWMVNLHQVSNEIETHLNFLFLFLFFIFLFFPLGCYHRPKKFPTHGQIRACQIGPSLKRARASRIVSSWVNQTHFIKAQLEPIIRYHISKFYNPIIILPVKYPNEATYFMTTIIILKARKTITIIIKIFKIAFLQFLHPTISHTLTLKQ